MQAISFGRNFKVFWKDDPLRGTSSEEIAKNSQMDRNAGRHRRLVTEVSNQLRQEVINASKTTVKEGTLKVEDEPVYSTILLGSDASLFQGLTRLLEKLTIQKKGEKVVYPHGLLANLSPDEHEQIVTSLKTAQNDLLEPEGSFRLDIEI